MLSNHIYFVLGLPCSGKTTVSKILQKKYDMLYVSGDSRRFDYFKAADPARHSYMKKDASHFYDWPVEEMIDWERGVISEQTPLILSDLVRMAESHDRVLFEGILDLELVCRIIPPNRIVYLTADQKMIEEEFFSREDHKPLLNSILTTPGISDEEKERRITLRRKAAGSSFCRDAGVYGIKQFERTPGLSVTEMLRRIETHFGLC